MKGKMFYGFLLMCLTSLILSGCGSENRSASTASDAYAQSAACISCHAGKTSPVTGVKIVDEWSGSKHNIKSGASCGDCHKPAAGHPIPVDVVKDPDTDGICFNCHNPTTLASHFYRYSSVNETKATWVTRYPGELTTINTEPNSISKYCSSCHNPHAPQKTISVNKAWAKAGHGDRDGEAWKHYDFKSASRAVCSRCHTTTGYIQFVKFNRYTSSFTFSYAWGTTGKAPREVLACVACHEDYSYKTRNVGAIKADYANNADYQYPDVKESNKCMACHVGRESGDSIKNLSTFTNFSSKSFENSHYLTAGGTLFGVTGYEYAGLNYSNVSYYKHDKIGLDNESGTGNNLGPCVACHMSYNSDEKHTFLPVAKNGETITEIKSTVCAKCHTGTYEMTPAKLNEEKEEWEAAMEVLKEALKAKGIYFYTSNPYFFKGPDGTGGNFTNWAAPYGKAKGKDTMGAAFNYNLLYHDPGSYVHNRFYTKRLIYDSIDYILNGVLGDNDVLGYINAHSDISSDIKSKAKKYLFGSETATTDTRP